MLRRVRIFVAATLALAAVACSRGSDRPSAPAPTAPSAAIVASAPSPASTINTSRPVVAVNPITVDFPPRNEAFDFRNRLEAKYRDGLRRPAGSTFVDLEGDVVWTQEYLRLRVNDCDHITAVQRVFAAIDARGSPANCNSATAPGEWSEIAFPPRNEPFDFRRQLDLKYQSMGRSPTLTFVDIEGIIVWLQEYFRYRVSSCGHQVAIDKVMTQIDGGGVQPDCTPPPPPPPSCVYAVSPTSHSVPVGGGALSFTVTRTSGNCSWTATSNSSFIKISGPTTGSDSATVAFNVDANTGTGSRTGTITVTWSSGTVTITVTQAGAPPSEIVASFRMFDFGRQPSATTQCQFRSLTGTPSTCTLDASTSFTLGRTVIVSYAWVVQYTYVDVKSISTTTTTPRLTFQDTCGLAGSTDDGSVQPLLVQLTVTDSAGNSVTVTSGSGSQPALSVALFTCGK